MNNLSEEDKEEILTRNKGFTSIDDSIQGILILTNSNGAKAVCTKTMCSGYFPLREENPVEVINDHIVMYYNDGYARVFNNGEWTGWFRPVMGEELIKVTNGFTIMQRLSSHPPFCKIDSIVGYRGNWIYLEAALRKENPVEVMFDGTGIVYRERDNWCMFYHNDMWIRQWFNPYEFREKDPFELKDGALIIHKDYWRIKIKEGTVKTLWPWES